MADPRAVHAGRYLVLTASMGSGHNQVARELAARLAGAGEVRIVDLLDILPAGIGRALCDGYGGMLRAAPWLYEGIFQTFFVPRGQHQPSTSPLVALAARRLRPLLADYRPTAVVSTFHLAGQVAGRLRAHGRLTAPSIVLITEPAAHKLWLHPATDLFICPYPAVAAEARSRTGRPAVAPGPLIDARFSRCTDSEAGRRALGLGPDEQAVLVSTGSWGVGDAVGTADRLAGLDGVRPVVLCGRNERLRQTLSAAGRCLALGWRDDLPDLFAAAAVLVDNAGGETCAEAFAAGLPVVTYRPLPGHGRLGVRALGAAGLVTPAGDGPALLDAVEKLRRPGSVRDDRRERAAAVFVDDPAAVLRRWLAERAATTGPE